MTEAAPTKVTGGDPLGEAAEKANGDAKASTDKSAEKKAEETAKTTSAATGVEPSKATDKVEKPEAEEGGKKIVHEGIAEAKPTKEVE